MPEQKLTLTLVNHVAVDIACAPHRVWHAILEEYVEAKKFQELGHTIEPLEDPAAILGGYRMHFEREGVVVDSRDCVITELDNVARRLSIAANYLKTPGGMKVYVTYHAKALERGTTYLIDCHSTLGVERPADDTPAGVKSVVDTLTRQFDEALQSYLDGVRAKLETTV